MKRAYENLLGRYLKIFPCVAIIGVRQCGKTTLLRTLLSPWKHFDLERRSDYESISKDPDLFFQLNQSKVAIDEAQLLPDVFPALRVAIDAEQGKKGRFVITGSSSPSLMKSVSESLAGRVGIIELSPFSWEEITETTNRDSFISRLSDRKAKPADLLSGIRARGTVSLAYDYWLRGGYPEVWLNQDAFSRQTWFEQYVPAYLHRDLKRLFPGLDDIRFRRFLELLGGLSGKILNNAEIARALGISQPTVRDYLEIAHGTFLWRTVPAFTKDVMKRAVKHPKGYLRDSGLYHALQRIPDMDAARLHPQAGAAWEGMVIEEIIRQFKARGIGSDYYFYRTGAGAEVDLVIENSSGLLAFEIKQTQNVDSRDLRGLRDFVREQKARLGVVINNDVDIKFYDEDIVGIPFSYL